MIVERTGERRGPSRVVPSVLILVGAGVCGLVWGVQNGLIHGVRAEWPAYVVGGAMIALGLKGLFRRVDAAGESGPVRESGLDDEGIAEEDGRRIATWEQVRERLPRSGRRP